MKIRDITEFLDSEVHPELQEDYDNAGFLIGDPESECTGALVALDLTEAVAAEAAERGANLIVTHHPAIFRGMKRITADTAAGRLVMRVIREGLAVYAAHTNFDNLPEGVNGALTTQLGIEDCRILRPLPGRPSGDAGAGMIGRLPYPMPAEAFLEQVKGCLGLPVLRVSEAAGQVVSRVAVCGGAGAFLIEDAVGAGADAYLTGDLKYHDFQQAAGRVTLVDIGHFESEQFCLATLYSLISKKFSNFAVRIAEKGRSYVNYM